MGDHQFTPPGQSPGAGLVSLRSSGTSCSRNAAEGHGRAPEQHAGGACSPTAEAAQLWARRNLAAGAALPGCTQPFWKLWKLLPAAQALAAVRPSRLQGTQALPAASPAVGFVCRLHTGKTQVCPQLPLRAPSFWLWSVLVQQELTPNFGILKKTSLCDPSSQPLTLPEQV